MEILSNSLLDWSRLQFAMTAMYHWLFVPLTLGLGVIMAIMETVYVRTGNEQWKKTAKFWQLIFGINFAIGVATGLILEFQFGTNWSFYSWTVGDIFGAPLAIEAIVAFFMEATFISIMFFGWKRVSKGAHLAATWLTITGATISALWILVANSWMQYPVGMEFNPDTMRFEMTDFFEIISPMAINKLIHTVISSWILGSIFAMGIAAWYMLKKRNIEFAKQTMKVATVFGLAASIITIWSGHGAAQKVAEHQPMKLAVMEGLYTGSTEANLVAFAIPNPDKTWNNDEPDYLFDIPIPGGLSWMSFGDSKSYVPGITNLIEGGYKNPKGKTELSFFEKQAMGKTAKDALKKFEDAKKAGNTVLMEQYRKDIMDNVAYLGYGYLENPEDTIPNISLTYWSFHIMVYLGGYFILLFLVVGFFVYKKDLSNKKYILWACILSIPLVYIASQAGWVVAEVGRQPWAIQDILPVQAAVSSLSASSVITTFILFLVLFTGLLIAEIRIMLNQIKKGPEA
ncbi:cytochrome ubiquinol oxidase subunit I [Dysgonomonas sp. 25]|nr:cytochrome ubiquinol oxidase subunit I [Dysgonomonas sp. 25]NDV67582.1 cytochrome ubiquinol oxidase subunit I [Dysgonomonas sp. 25]